MKSIWGQSWSDKSIGVYPHMAIRIFAYPHIGYLHMLIVRIRICIHRY